MVLNNSDLFYIPSCTRRAADDGMARRSTSRARAAPEPRTSTPFCGEAAVQSVDHNRVADGVVFEAVAPFRLPPGRAVSRATRSSDHTHGWPGGDVAASLGRGSSWPPRRHRQPQPGQHAAAAVARGNQSLARPSWPPSTRPPVDGVPTNSVRRARWRVVPGSARRLCSQHTSVKPERWHRRSRPGRASSCSW